MLELTALLLPIAAASGWYAAAKHYQNKGSGDGFGAVNRTYLRSLNFLLAEKPEQAIDAFVDILEEDIDTVETHVALGNLFRRRGEVDRAISIHQGLMVKPSLDDEHRALVSFELGMDYMRAGLFGRAEKVFIELTADPIHKESAMQQLLQIFQHEKEWLKAAQYTRALDKLGKIQRGESVAQFHCEIAEEAMLSGQTDRAVEHLKKALHENKSCVRASLLKAKIERSQKQYRTALHTLKRIEKQDSSYVCEMIGPVMECYDHLAETNEQILYLQYLFKQYHLEEIIIILAELIRKTKGINAAVEFLCEALARYPSLKGINHFITLQIGKATGDCQSILSELKGLFVQLSNEEKSYRCAHCGFSCVELHWYCPSCHHWETIKPRVLRKSC